MTDIASILTDSDTLVEKEEDAILNDIKNDVLKAVKTSTIFDATKLDDVYEDTLIDTTEPKDRRPATRSVFGFLVARILRSLPGLLVSQLKSCDEKLANDLSVATKLCPMRRLAAYTSSTVWLKITGGKMKSRQVISVHLRQMSL